MMRRSIPVLIFLVLISAAPRWVGAQSHEHHHPSHGAENDLDKNRPSPLTQDSVYQLGSKWKNQDGTSVLLSQFRGKPLVLAMAYTKCQVACPIIVSDLRRIEKEFSSSQREQVQFALFSLDSERDNPKQLKAYAQAHGLDPKVWTLLTSGSEEVRELAAVLGIRYKRDSKGEFSHSNVISILNPSGEILHQQVGLRKSPKESIEAVTGVLSKASR